MGVLHAWGRWLFPEKVEPGLSVASEVSRGVVGWDCVGWWGHGGLSVGFVLLRWRVFYAVFGLLFGWGGVFWAGWVIGVVFVYESVCFFLISGTVSLSLL